MQIGDGEYKNLGGFALYWVEPFEYLTLVLCCMCLVRGVLEIY